MLTALPPFRARVKRSGSLFVHLLVCFNGMDRDNLTFIFQYQIMK